MNKLISISSQRLDKSTTKGNRSGKNEMLYIKQLTLILNLQTDSYDFFTDFEEKKPDCFAVY